MRAPAPGLGELTTQTGSDAPGGSSWVRIDAVLDRVHRDPGAPPAPLGRFVVQAVLGRGGMGVVLAAHDPRLDRKVALKLVDEARSDALGEARALARLSHPHIVGVYEVGEVDGVPFIAMELVEGCTLGAWLQADARELRGFASTRR
jgi:serine/threonine protein kinase